MGLAEYVRLCEVALAMNSRMTAVNCMQERDDERRMKSLFSLTAGNEGGRRRQP
jgi:hypothetical protein